jgi:hypothetical protein
MAQAIESHQNNNSKIPGTRILCQWIQTNRKEQRIHLGSTYSLQNDFGPLESSKNK